MVELMKKIVLFASFVLCACVSVPEGISPIKDFNVNRYLGKWYEIARLENRFEEGLKQITAEYTVLEDGEIKVLNRGVNIETGKPEVAEGKAFFIDKPNVGSLKVSFFWPFYGGYHIVELDRENYGYVMISGSDRDYLWILAREPKLDSDILKKLIDKASQLGFNTSKLIFPEQ